MNEDVRAPDDRMESFHREIVDETDHNAELYDTEIAVTIVGDEEAFTVGLQPVLTAGLRYGLVAFDGEAGNNTATLHFKPQEHIGRSGRVGVSSSGRISTSRRGGIERAYHATTDVADRWDITISDAEAFLEGVGFFGRECSEERADEIDREDLEDE